MVVGVLLLASIPMSYRTSAAPGVPFNLYGKAYTNAAVAFPDDELISSWIDGVRYNFGDNLTWGQGVGDPGNFDVDTISNNTRAWDPVIGDWDPDTPEVVEGGYNGSQVMYLHGNGTSFDTNTIFQESAVWMYGGSVNMDLYEADMTLFRTFYNFEWLVINNLTADSTVIPGNIDYVRLYNPGPNPIDLRNYSFEKNDGQPIDASPTFPITISSLVMNPTLFNIAPGDRAWVNLTALGLDLNSSGDELKLVWNNPNIPNAPFGGNNVVVDRVEYNATVGGTHFGEPDNTTMLDADAAGPGFEIYRVVEGQDTNDCFVDFGIQAESPWFPVMPAQVVVTATHDPLFPNDIKLNWTAVASAYGYFVYRDLPIDLNNPLGIVIGGAVTQWFDMGAYVDGFNFHLYLALSWGTGGINTFINHNLAYKLNVTLNYYLGVKNGGVNYLSLPFYMNLTVGPDINNAAALFNDMGGAPNVVSISRWDPSMGAWEVYPGINFQLVRGEAYRVEVASTMIYTVVGAHRNVSITVTYNDLDEGGVLNYVSAPYHVILSIPDAATLLTTLNTIGIPMNGITRVARWDGSTGQWQSKTAIGINFLLTMGEGYLVVTNTTVTFP